MTEYANQTTVLVCNECLIETVAELRLYRKRGSSFSMLLWYEMRHIRIVFLHIQLRDNYYVVSEFFCHTFVFLYQMTIWMWIDHTSTWQARLLPMLLCCVQPLCWYTSNLLLVTMFQRWYQLCNETAQDRFLFLLKHCMKPYTGEFSSWHHSIKVWYIYMRCISKGMTTKQLLLWPMI